MLDVANQKVDAASVRSMTEDELSKLPLHQREVAIAYFNDNKTYAEIAVACRVRPGTVRSRLNRARHAVLQMRRISE